MNPIVPLPEAPLYRDLHHLPEYPLTSGARSFKKPQSSLSCCSSKWSKPSLTCLLYQSPLFQKERIQRLPISLYMRPACSFPRIYASTFSDAVLNIFVTFSRSTPDARFNPITRPCPRHRVRNRMASIPFCTCRTELFENMPDCRVSEVLMDTLLRTESRLIQKSDYGANKRSSSSWQKARPGDE